MTHRCRVSEVRKDELQPASRRQRHEDLHGAPVAAGKVVLRGGGQGEKGEEGGHMRVTEANGVEPALVAAARGSEGGGGGGTEE